MVRISWEHIENNKNPTTPISQKIAWAPWALAARSFFCVLVFSTNFWPRLMAGVGTMGLCLYV